MIEDWQETRIEDIAERIAMGPFGSDIKVDNFVPQGVPIIRGGNLSSGRFNDDNFVYLTEEKADKLSAANAFQDDIVFTHRGTLGQVGIIPKTKFARYVVSQSQMKLTCKTNLAAPPFIYYFFKSNIGQQALLINTSQTGVPAISRPVTSLKNITILLPSLPEQRRIAHILGTLDDKIENNRKTAKTLEAMAQAIFQSWFVDFDPVRAKMAGESRESICKRLKLTPEILDLFPDRLVDSELGEIPEGWRVGTFEDYADIVGGSTPSTSNPDFWITGIHSWATPKDLANLKVPVLLSTEHRITETGLQQISSRLLPVGTVLLSSRAPIGYVAITETPVAINQGFIALKPYNLENNIFIMLLIKKQMEEIISRANGSTFLEISKAKFRPIPVIFPLEPVLIFFAALVRPYYSRIVSLEKLTQILTACRESLLPRLISGEIRLMENENILHHYEKMNQ